MAYTQEDNPDDNLLSLALVWRKVRILFLFYSLRWEEKCLLVGAGKIY